MSNALTKTFKEESSLILELNKDVSGKPNFLATSFSASCLVLPLAFWY